MVKDSLFLPLQLWASPKLAHGSSRETPETAIDRTGTSKKKRRTPFLRHHHETEPHSRYQEGLSPARRERARGLLPHCGRGAGRGQTRSEIAAALEEGIVWWVSYRGEGKAGIENIGVFEDDGAPRKKHPLLLDPSPDAHPLPIARGFAQVGDDLYIANAWRRDSHIARYHRCGATFRFADLVVTSKQVSAMIHPFDVELGDDGRIYVSCQDTNTVLAILPATRKPAPVAIHLRKSFPKGNFLPGTLVASSQGSLPECGDHSPLDVPAPQGLGVVLDVHGRPR